jgi:hypothetical protein
VQPGRPDPERAAKLKYYKKFMGPLGIGLVVIAIGLAAMFYLQRGAHVELRGSVLKVRTASLDENSSVAVIDFRFVNPADVPFVVRKVDVTMVNKDGSTTEGLPVSEVDAKSLFQYYPLLGQKFNDSLLMRDKIPGRKAEDRMIAARFDLPAEKLEERKTFRIRIEDVDGPASELVEKP